jgi:hypothetical protein
VSLKHSRKYYCALLEALIEVADEGGIILENLKELNLKDVYYTTQALGEIQRKHVCGHGESLWRRKTN